MITSEQGKRGGRFLALKHTVDHAVAACPCVKKVRTCAGRVQPSRVAARRDGLLSVLFVQVFVFARGEADPSVHVHYHGTSPCVSSGNVCASQWKHGDTVVCLLVSLDRRPLSPPPPHRHRPRREDERGAAEAAPLLPRGVSGQRGHHVSAVHQWCAAVHRLLDCVWEGPPSPLPTPTYPLSPR